MAQVPSVLVYFWTLYKNLPKLVSVLKTFYFDHIWSLKPPSTCRIFGAHCNSTTQQFSQRRTNLPSFRGTLKLPLLPLFAPLLLDDVEEWCRKCTTLFYNPPWQRGLFLKTDDHHPSIFQNHPKLKHLSKLMFWCWTHVFGTCLTHKNLTKKGWIIDWIRQKTRQTSSFSNEHHEASGKVGQVT